MFIVRFKISCRPDQSSVAATALSAVVAPARALPGVLAFDIARDLTDPHAFIATEVFEDRDAIDRQEALPEVAKVLGLLGEVLAAPPEATLYHVSFSEPHGA